MSNAELEDDKQDADFDAGYTGAAPTTDKSPAVAEVPPEETEAKPAAATPEPEFKISKSDWEEIRAAAARTASYEQQFSRIYGTLGNIQQNLRKPAAEATTEVKDPAVKGVDEDAAIRKRVTDAAVEREIEALEDLHPTWKDIVGVVDAEGKPPENDFRKWLATQPAEYQQRINATNSSTVISRSIDKFRDAQTAAATKAAADKAVNAKNAARKDLIAAAVTPKGDGRPASQGKTADEEFDSGFRDG